MRKCWACHRTDFIKFRPLQKKVMCGPCYHEYYGVADCACHSHNGFLCIDTWPPISEPSPQGELLHGQQIEMFD